jgi:hypothetical protein
VPNLIGLIVVKTAGELAITYITSRERSDSSITKAASILTKIFPTG